MNASQSSRCIALFSSWLLVIAAICGDPCVDLRAAEAEPLVLLTNGNILRGSAQVQGDVVILNREDGNKLRLRRDQVLHIANTLDELYRYRSQQRTSHNSASHIDDAKWCLRNGLVASAEAELSKLVELDPSHPEVGRIRRQIESAKSPHAKAPLVLPTAPPEHVVASRAATAPMPEGISPTSVAAFVSRVQPLLINRCGNTGCHRTGSDTKFQLSHLGVNVRVSARMTQRNLISALNHVNMDDPFSSQLLKYSKAPHGGDNIPSAGHAAQSAETTLRDWLSQLGRYPQPLVANTIFDAGPSGTNRLASAAVAGPWPIVQVANTELGPEGFTTDANGELVYNPAGRSDVASAADSNPTPSDLVPPGWPAPVIGPIIRKDPFGASTNQNGPGATPRNHASVSQPTESVRPKRLPTIENPFSADLFNRQHQQLSASNSSKP